MISLVVIGLILFALVILIFIFKYQNYQGSLVNFCIGLFIIFLIGSVGYVYLNSDVNLSNFEGIIGFGKLYFSWLGDVFKNMGRIVGYAVHQGWAVNNTNVTG